MSWFNHRPTKYPPEPKPKEPPPDTFWPPEQKN